MTPKPGFDRLIRAYFRASTMVGTCGLKLFLARQSGDPLAARAIKRRLGFWQRRVSRMDAKLRAGRYVH